MIDIQEIVDTFIEDPLLAIGFYGPIILIGINIYFLYDRFFWLCIYLCFIVINTLINKALKIWIKEPRPNNGKYFISFERLEKEENYGMPSGHAQSAMFSIIFYYLIFGIDEVLYVMFVITILTIYQRYINKNHSSLQLGIGLIVGGILACIVFCLVKKYKNKLYL
jgi:membrane-associated phospholipid phosphatase